MSHQNIVSSEKFFVDEISLKEVLCKLKMYIKNLFNYKITLILSILIGIISGYIFFKNQKIKYKAEINFVLEEDKGTSLSGASAVATQLGLDLGSSSGNIFSGENLIYLFKTKTIIERTLLKPIVLNTDTILLANYYLENVKNNKSEVLNKRSKHFFSKNIKKENYDKNTIKLLRTIDGDILKDILEVKQKDKKTSINTIQVTSKSEIFSKLFCEEIAKDVSNYYIENKIKKAKINKEILQKQVDSIRYELNNAINGTAKAMDQIFNLNPSLLVNKTPSTKRQVDIQTNSAILTQLITNLEMAKVALRKETPLIQVIEYPELPLEIVSINLTQSILIFVFISLLISIILIHYLSYKKLNK
jgi:hypothetical protein